MGACCGRSTAPPCGHPDTQVFDAAALRRALDVDAVTLASATDDAGLVEAAGGRVRLLQAPPENLKVARAIDLRLAELLLAARSALP